MTTKKLIQKTHNNLLPLKVAIFTSLSIFPPISGTSKLIYDTAIELAKRKHGVTLVSFATGVSRELTVSRLGSVVFIKIPLRRPWHQLLALSRYVCTRVFPWLQFALLRVYQLFLKLNGIDLSIIIGSEHYDAFFCEDLRIFPAVLALRKKADTPIIYRLHSIQAITNTRETPFTSIAHILIPIALKISKASEEFALRESDVVLTLSLNDSKLVKEIYGVTSECVGIGSDSKEYLSSETFVKQHGLESGQYLLYVSSYKSGIDIIIRAAEELPKHRFVLVGKGSSLIDSYKMPKNLVSLGIVSEKALEALYKHAKIVLIPMNWGPGLGVPIKIVEALAHGKPAIVTTEASKALPGMKHLENIVVFSTFTELLNSIALIFNDSILEKKIAQEAKTYATKHFQWKSIIENIERIIEELSTKTKKYLYHPTGA